MDEEKKVPGLTICKFTCQTVTRDMYGNEIVKLSASYDTSLPEDRRFAAATPSGNAEFYISNPNLRGWYEPGKAYYLTATPVTEAKK